MAESIMLQGTMSNAGKSILTAALCRIFKQDGYSCAPFKSQNMALNSFVTADGAEMGRAQVMQAEAAGTEPSALMNPILLKPTSDLGSQVILHGKPIGNRKASDYFRHKKELIPEIMKAYRELQKRYDVIVIEGAGSPVELNLKKDDIVNMGMARLARSPVLLVGDIDRGGVFAQLLGTLSLLEEDERAMVKGLLVNKFRGDKALFRDGVEILEARGGKPVVGVIPWLECDLEDEDSLSDKLNAAPADTAIRIAAIRFPRISNFTDLDVFREYEGVGVRFVTRPRELENADLILLPGSKSVISDRKWLRESGLEERIVRAAAEGVPVFGICGGYQMLGKRISDPCGAEGGGYADGLGLLDGETVFSEEKIRTRISGTFAETGGIFSALSGTGFSGYEIHMGRTVSRDKPLLTCGGAQRDNVYGCYVHGIFDETGVSEKIVAALYERRGLTYSGKTPDRKAYKERQYDLLADGVRKNINLERIYQILHKGL